ncbi:aminotransferase-like domain-containing protein [Clostridium luticellarii]|jgi:2-aminoadipate transaminase|uniref:2-aminoadipate transaminase n=1 Tax=Clostridium luticellarii TaxID=1691940 RepID=A0A2T0B437_9CLOT|nr:PLP-dependent aminotransferase family protein [Clostridium luticellarii]MCI1944164.1 PLP-dependent aminotransferase family protein [Clostridium luticellarii]MCI1967666.1 PLP-dependent aminotransferase family protein [Clostridium luticellarii]MCI1994884.1 PLP-dependent aminotransferase family protein [Clostridium luticellarii]MCI2039975.1 PLP-dependent aminotransferase family protein [Clostridium luticellarii]PRR78655.1 2-aminoadipate transaminase [Clostridium luticellarii]
MKTNFSKRAEGLKASEIRELLKLTEMPEIISFAGGLPAPELFPVKEMKQIMQDVLDKDGIAAMQYSTTEGFKPLRNIIAKQRMVNSGVNVTGEDIIITSGSQEGIEFSAKIFVNEGDTIICESPSYMGAINAFKAYRPKFTEIEMDDNGMIMEKLEDVLKKDKKVKMIYTIPDFQNPTGITMSDDRRKRLAELAKEYEVPVIEDNPYGELIFEGTTHPSIKSFDKDGWVIYLGTYSKTFCPGFRIGWICAEPDILQKYVIIKQGVDLQCSSLDQRATALFMETYDLNEHIAEIKKVYGKRRTLMLQSMDQYFPKEIKHTNPYGGLFAWVKLKDGLNSKEILEEALKEKVAYVPGGSFFPNGGRDNHFRLNYSCMPEEKIVEGIKRLGKVLYKYY